MNANSAKKWSTPEISAAEAFDIDQCNVESGLVETGQQQPLDEHLLAAISIFQLGLPIGPKNVISAPGPRPITAAAAFLCIRVVVCTQPPYLLSLSNQPTNQPTTDWLAED
jgi:hypothetical protein